MRPIDAAQVLDGLADVRQTSSNRHRPVKSSPGMAAAYFRGFVLNVSGVLSADYYIDNLETLSYGFAVDQIQSASSSRSRLQQSSRDRLHPSHRATERKVALTKAGQDHPSSPTGS
jgi:hypothetical protein